MFNEDYIRRQEILQTRAIYRILKSQKEKFIEFLIKEDKSFFKIVNDFAEKIKLEIPDFLDRILPNIMNEAIKPPKKQFESLKDFNLSFNIETSPASRYIRETRELYLSDYKWSILKTTKDELDKIISNWIDAWLSYTQIAKQIRETDPFVFSKSRAKMIAVNEVGRAYGFANYQPALELEKQWFTVEKKWNTSRDDKVRPTHNANWEQGRIDIWQNFIWTGDAYAPSHDINCRCTLVYRTI